MTHLIATIPMTLSDLQWVEQRAKIDHFPWGIWTPWFLTRLIHPNGISNYRLVQPFLQGTSVMIVWPTHRQTDRCATCDICSKRPHHLCNVCDAA